MSLLIRVYTGESDRYRWLNKVTVTVVVDGKLVDIQPENGEALELELSEQIIGSQSF